MLKGVYTNGVVILDDATGLRNGTRVEIVPVRGRKTGPASKPAAGPKRKAVPKAVRAKQRPARRPAPAGLLEGFGMWKDRSDWKGKTTREIAAELRRKAMGRFGG